MYYKCGVYKCGGDYDTCIHELTNEKCPHCGKRMVRVTTTNFMFCSEPDTINVCDYDYQA